MAFMRDAEDLSVAADSLSSTIFESRGTTDAIAMSDATSRLSTFARFPMDVAPVSDHAIDLSGLVVRLLFEEAQAGDTGHPSIALHKSALDALTSLTEATSSISLHKDVFDSAYAEDFTYWFVSKTMGYLIWPERGDGLLQNHPQFTHQKELPISPINLLRIFEGRMFPRTEGPDVFSFQLTAYPLSVNKPRQTTNVN
jgi:hypothetical protein